MTIVLIARQTGKVLNLVLPRQNVTGLLSPKSVGKDVDAVILIHFSCRLISSKCFAIQRKNYIGTSERLTMHAGRMLIQSKWLHEVVS